MNSAKSHILIIDDDEMVCNSLIRLLESKEYEISVANSGEAALEIIPKSPPDLAILDFKLPKMDGLSVLAYIKEEYPDMQIIMLTAYANISLAVDAMKLGAYDFLEKEAEPELVRFTVQKALDNIRLKKEVQMLRQEFYKGQDLDKIVAESNTMQRILSLAEQFAASDTTTLLTGETGTGKSIIAEYIHFKSPRFNQPFLTVNCGAIPRELIESELFGHEKGAFTGASSMKRGKFDLANGGTLFLDEIGDMSLKTQAKILRILQEQRFCRVGGSKTIKVDVRIIAATNKDLEEAIKRGEFREDLYFRLNVIPIEVPPLRDRREDIPLLVNEFIEEFRRENIKAPVRTVSPEVIEALKQYDWPGNVRELRNITERMFILSGKSEITLDDLPATFRSCTAGSSAGTGGMAIASSGLAPCFQCDDFRQARAIFEKEYLSFKLQEHDGNIKKTAEAIGIERRHLHRKIKSLEINT